VNYISLLQHMQLQNASKGKKGIYKMSGSYRILAEGAAVV